MHRQIQLQEYAHVKVDVGEVPGAEEERELGRLQPILLPRGICGFYVENHVRG